MTFPSFQECMCHRLKGSSVWETYHSCRRVRIRAASNGLESRHNVSRVHAASDLHDGLGLQVQGYMDPRESACDLVITVHEAGDVEVDDRYLVEWGVLQLLQVLLRHLVLAVVRHHFVQLDVFLAEHTIDLAILVIPPGHVLHVPGAKQ